MKKFLFAASALAAVCAAERPALALRPEILRQYEMQKETSPQNRVGVRPTDLVTGAVKVDYERVLGKNVSVVLTPEARLGDLGFKSDGKWIRVSPNTSVGGQASLRIRPVAEGLHGLFVEPYVGYSHMFDHQAANGRVRLGGRAALGGARVGYQWLLGSHAAVSVSGGGHAQYAWGAMGTRSRTGGDDGLSFVPDAALGVGFAF